MSIVCQIIISSSYSVIFVVGILLSACNLLSLYGRRAFSVTNIAEGGADLHPCP
jgi:hypothetical protein